MDSSVLNINSIEEVTWKAKKFDELEGDLAGLVKEINLAAGVQRDALASLQVEIASLREELSLLINLVCTTGGSKNE
jgi:hypothetical protein